MESDAPSTCRVIVHLDLDCFYAQVEQRRLEIPADQPVAVQQWGSLLAVNYVARKFGVLRGAFSPLAAYLAVDGPASAGVGCSTDYLADCLLLRGRRTHERRDQEVSVDPLGTAAQQQQQQQQ